MKLRNLVSVSLALLVLGAPALAFAKQVPSVNVTDLDGKRHKIHDIIGDCPVLINFWATWCKPCLAEQPKIAEFEEAMADKGFRVISINIDDPRTQKQVKPFVHKQEIPFTVYVDPNQDAYQRLGGRAIPYNVLVGAGGEILKVSMGYREKDAEDWAALLEADYEANPCVSEKDTAAEEKAESEVEAEGD